MVIIMLQDFPKKYCKSYGYIKTNKNNYTNYKTDITKLNYINYKINCVSNKLKRKIFDEDIESLLISIEKLL